MRPSDEHQHRSKRPNLFSSSRSKAGGEDHILARLEAGMPARSHGAAPKRAHPAVLGGAGVLVLGLIGTLFMLAGSPPKPPRHMEVSAATLATSSAPVQQHVTILDESPAPDPGPALVTLVDEPEVPAPAVVSAALAPVVRAAPAAPRRRAPAPEPLRSGFKAQVASAKPAPAKPPRRASTVQTELDPDVALLSVILAQTARHSSKGYGEDDCGTRRQPCPATKF